MQASLPWEIAIFARFLLYGTRFLDEFHLIPKISSITLYNKLNRLKFDIWLIWFVVLVLGDLTIFNVKIFPRIGSLVVRSRSNCCLSASNVRRDPGHGTSCNRPGIVAVLLQNVLTKYFTKCPDAMDGHFECPHAMYGHFEYDVSQAAVRCVMNSESGLFTGLA